MGDWCKTYKPCSSVNMCGMCRLGPCALVSVTITICSIVPITVYIQTDIGLWNMKLRSDLATEIPYPATMPTTRHMYHTGNTLPEATILHRHGHDPHFYANHVSSYYACPSDRGKILYSWPRTESIFNMEYFDFCFLNFGIRALRYISTWNTWAQHIP